MRRLFVVLAVSATVLVACGDKQPARTASRSSTTSSSSTTTSLETTETSTASGGVVAGSSTTTASGGTAGTSAARTDSTGATPPAAPAPVPRGTYKYRQSGKATVGSATTTAPPEGTLVVDAPKPDGSQTFHRIVQQGQSSTDTTLLFRADGIFLREMVLRNQSVTFSCTFDPPVPSPPWPPAVGRTFSGHGECGSFTAQVSGKIESTRRVTLDGKSLDVFVIRTTATTSGQLQSTTNEVDWFAPGPRLLVHTESQQKGMYNVFSFSNDLTSDLISGKPV